MHFAVALNGEQAGQEVTGSDITRLVSADDLVWVHLDADNDRSRRWIRSNLTYLDHHAIEALLAEETRPRVTEIGQGALIILRGINLNEGADPHDMVSTRLWVDANRIISLNVRASRSVAEVKKMVLSGDGPDNAGDFICTLIERMTTRIEGFRHMLDETVDEMEQLVIEAPDQDQRRPIMESRLQTIIFRRYISPQRDEIGHLMRSALPWLQVEDKRRLHEVHNNLIRIVEDLDSMRERLQILKDELASIMGDRLNKNMYILSIFTALFLPLGFLTGLFGVNLAGIPGAAWGASFWVFLALLLGVAGLQYLVFRLLKWF